MIVKEISLPLRIQKVEALSKRLKEDHPKGPDIQQDLINLLSGYKGEKALAYYLDFLPDKGYYIFHNLRLPSGKYYFQIDYLVMTTHFAIVLECKNFFGSLFFDEAFKQLIRTANGQEEAFPDPVSQAKWHKEQLRVWLKEHHFPNIPIEYLIIISNPATILKTNSNSAEIKKHVVHSQIFLERFRELGSKFRQEVTAEKGLRKLSKLLLKSHTPEDGDVLKKYGLASSDIVTGVRCPSCSHVPMIRAYGTWVCPSCQKKEKNAHLSALHDYFLLIDSTITNKQFRDFVQLSSDDVAKRLLTRLNLPISGANKDRKYHKPKDTNYLKRDQI